MAECSTQKVVVIAASAGGISALTQVLARLPADLPAAVLVVQHLQRDRQTCLPEYLSSRSQLPVRLAQEGLPVAAGVVYLAVPGQHLRVQDGLLALSTDDPVNHVRPSADILFASAAQSFGPKVLGVILSGTGRDGAHGCREIKARGGTTIAQDEETSAHFGMPGAAINLEAIDQVLPLQHIAERIIAEVADAKNQDDQRH